MTDAESQRRKRRMNGRAYGRKLDGYTNPKRLRRLIELDILEAKLATLRDLAYDLLFDAGEGEEWKQA